MRTEKISVNPLHPHYPRSIVELFITNAGYSFPYMRMRTALGWGQVSAGRIFATPGREGL